MTRRTSREFEECYQKWFWRDYISDERVLLCSLAAQGLWIRMLGYMFLSAQRGFLYLADKPVSKQNASKLLAKLCGETEAAICELLGELEEAGVFSTCEHETIYNRRMVREAELSRARAEAGSKGGAAKQNASKTQAKHQANAKQTVVNQNPESRIQNPKDLNNSCAPKPRDYPPNFEIFWKACARKKNKGDALKAWKALKPDDALLEKILRALEAAKKSPEWMKDGGQFIPYPATWLRAAGWEDEDTKSTPYPEALVYNTPEYWAALENERR